MGSRRSRGVGAAPGAGALATIVAAMVHPGLAKAEKTRTPAEIAAIAEDAYVYGYPLVLMDATKRAMTAVDEPGPRGAPVNRFAHSRSTPSPAMRWVVRPNLDTLYSTAWLDLSKEPVILRIPKITDRYYLLQMMDGWTNVFAAPGTRSIEPGEHTYAIVGPNFKGALPAGVEPIQSPTNMAWILGRTQIKNPKDEASARAIEVNYTLEPLSAFEERKAPLRTEPVDLEAGKQAPPPEEVSRMDGVTFFSKLSELMRDNPAPEMDAPALERFAAIGFVPGQLFRPTAEVQRVLADVPATTQKKIREEFDKRLPSPSGWRSFGEDVGAFGTHYEDRAVIAMKGLGANLAEDAVYPAAFADGDGEPLTGAHRYVLHFAAGKMPPVKAFWSLTLYDDEGRLVENSIARYALRDRDALKRNADGSLDLYIQHEAPGADERCNWLPAPPRDFNLLLRMYMPKEEVLNGRWQPPPVRRTDAG